MKRKRLFVSLLFAGLIAALPPVTQAAAPSQQGLSQTIADPAQQLRAMANMLRANDLPGLLSALLPPTQLQQLRLAYDLHRTEPSSDADRVKFAEALAKLNAVDSVDQLMAEIEPKLQEARPQAVGAVMMGLGALQVAVASPQAELTELQRAALQSMLPGLQRWATNTDFLSSASMRQALTLLSNAARSSGVNNLDQLKMLSLDEVLAHAGSLLAAGKQAVRIYGLDLDAITDSLQVQVLSVDGHNARVRATWMVFDAPVSSEHDLVWVAGRWYGKDVAAHWSVEHASAEKG